MRIAWAIAHEGTTVVVRPKEFSEKMLADLQEELSTPRAVPLGPHELSELHWRSPMGLAAAMLAAVREEGERKPSRPNAVVGRQRTISVKRLLDYLQAHPRSS